MLLVGAGVLLLSCPLLVACSGAETSLDDFRDQGRRRSDPIIGGQMTDDLESVVLLEILDGGDGSWCTGTVIGTRLVLTAAHCMESAIPGATQVQVMFGSDADRSEPADHVQVAEWHMDPRYMETGDLAAGHDAAVLVLASDALGPVLPINRRALTPQMVGSRVLVMGFGADDGDAGTGSGVKRDILTTLHSLEQGVMNVGEPGQTICTGDSGGPAFMSIEDELVIAGISSYVKRGCVSYGSATRVDLSAPWIDRYIEEDGGGE